VRFRGSALSLYLEDEDTAARSNHRKLGRKLVHHAMHCPSTYPFSGNANWNLTKGKRNGDQRRSVSLVVTREGLRVYFSWT